MKPSLVEKAVKNVLTKLWRPLGHCVENERLMAFVFVAEDPLQIDGILVALNAVSGMSDTG